MSLYYDAASILNSTEHRGSLKSRIYNSNNNSKSKPAHIYALISEVAKYDILIKEVIDNAGILALEPKLSPLLALLLVHDHFFAKSGIAAASAHPLRQSVEKHKARLQSEFTRARLRRKAASVQQLREILVAEKGGVAKASPRWARVNLVKISVENVLRDSFGIYKKVESVDEVVRATSGQKVLHIDRNIPNLIAFPPDQDLTRTPAYNDGLLILQDKASCFPAHLLLGNALNNEVGDVVDGCAAPGNKTTHAAAIMSSFGGNNIIYGCERDTLRSKTLQSMVKKAGADKIITVLARQDFLALDPNDIRFASVTHLLLDPSCSGSGILGREDIPKLSLPIDPRSNKDQTSTNVKKRKRETDSNLNGAAAAAAAVIDEDVDNDPTSEAQPLKIDKARLEKLSTLQSLIVEHAFRFPAARRVTYSTCSIHEEENEGVVHRVLRSKIGSDRGWRVLRRDEQVEGLKIWKQRGRKAKDSGSDKGSHQLSDDEIEACIGCSPHDSEGTMGFFVCGFVRDVEASNDEGHDLKNGHNEPQEEDWEGFSDS